MGRAHRREAGSVEVAVALGSLRDEEWVEAAVFTGLYTTV